MDAGVHTGLGGGEAAEEVFPRHNRTVDKALVASGEHGVGLDLGDQGPDLADVDDIAGAERGHARDDATGDVTPDAVQETEVDHPATVHLGALPGVTRAADPHAAGRSEVVKSPADDHEVAVQ